MRKKNYDNVLIYIVRHRDGHAIYGPFKTADAAAKYGAAKLSCGWYISPVFHPLRGE